MSDSPMEQAQQAARDLVAALESTGLVEVVEPKAATNQIHLLCRVRPDMEKNFLDGPLTAMWSVVGPNDELFSGKSYFPRGGKFRYGWVLSVGSDDLTNLVDAMDEAIRDDMRPEPAATIDVIEAPMLGPAAPQSASRPGSKGASPVR